MRVSTQASGTVVLSTNPFAARSRLVRVALLTSVQVVAGVALMLLVRRFAGALEKPLSAAGLLLVGGVVSSLAAAARGVWRVAGSQNGRDRLDGWFNVSLTVGVLGLVTALSLPHSPLIPLAVAWTLIVGGEAAAWMLALRGRTARAPENVDSGSVLSSEPFVTTATVEIRAAESMSEELMEPDEGDVLPPGVSQRITRAKDENDGDVVFGLVRCEFAPGERQQNVHIAFCPPLHRVPHLSTDQVDGPAARIKISLVETFGAGLEVKLVSPSSQPASVQIQFYACEQSTDETA
jgi:hypothetical protein